MTSMYGAPPLAPMPGALYGPMPNTMHAPMPVAR